MRVKFEAKRLPHDKHCYTVCLTPLLVTCWKNGKLELGLLWLNWELSLYLGESRDRY